MASDNREGSVDSSGYKRPKLNKKSRKNMSEEEKANFTDRKRASAILEKRLDPKIGLRPSQFELEQRGLVPPNVFDDFTEVMIKQQNDRRVHSLNIARHLTNRPTPTEIAGDTSDDYASDLKRFMEDYSRASSEGGGTMRPNISSPPAADDIGLNTSPDKKQRSANGKGRSNSFDKDNPLNWKLAQRSRPQELVARGIVPTGYDEVITTERDYLEPKKDHARTRSMVQETLNSRLAVKQRPMPHELEQRGIVPIPDSLAEPDQAQSKWKNQRRKSKNMLNARLRQRMNPEEAAQRGIVDPLDFEKDPGEVEQYRRNERKQIASKLKRRVSERPNKAEVIARGVVDEEEFGDDHDVVAQRKRDHRKALSANLDTMWSNRPRPEEMQSKGFLSPMATDGDESPYRVYVQNPKGSYGGADDDDDDAMSPSERSKEQRRKSLQIFVANRPHPDEMIRNQKLPDGYFEDPNAAVSRQKTEQQDAHNKFAMKFTQRAPPNEVADRGIIHPEYLKFEQDVETAADNIMGSRLQTTEVLAQKLDFNKKKQNSYDDDDEAYDSDEDSAPPARAGTFLERLENEKKQQRLALEKHQKKRPSVLDLENMGIVPAGYFNNPTNTVAKAHERRKSAASELADFFKQRPDVAGMVARGLYRAEYLVGDVVDGGMMELEHREEVMDTLDRKLNSKRRPSKLQLEQTGIVPAGYFNNPQQAVKAKHQRRESAQQDLSGFLKGRIGPADFMKKNFIPTEFYTEMGIPRPAAGTTLPPEIQQFLPYIGGHDPNVGPPVDLDSQPIFVGDMGHPPTQLTKPPPLQNNQHMVVVQNQQPPPSMISPMGIGAMMVQRQMKEQMRNVGMHPNESSQQQYYKATESKIVEAVEAQHMKSTSHSGIVDLVYSVPQTSKNPLVQQENWSHSLYTSLLSDLKFQHMSKALHDTLEADKGNRSEILKIQSQFDTFQTNYYSQHSDLQRGRHKLTEQKIECESAEKSSLEILTRIIGEHSSLENKIRPQLKELLYRQTVAEYRFDKAQQRSEETKTDSPDMKQLKDDLSYYDRYITQLKDTLSAMNTVRLEYQNTIHKLMSDQQTIDRDLKLNAQKFDVLQESATDQMYKLHNAIRQISPNSAPSKIARLNDRNETKEELSKADMNNLESVINAEDAKLGADFQLLEFRLSTIPVRPYVSRMVEICQLSYIYENELIKSFFEYFIRFAAQSFTEIIYAHKCFIDASIDDPSKKVSNIGIIKLIAECTAADASNREPYDKTLSRQLAHIVDYLSILPNRSEVIFHVARALSAHQLRSTEILNTSDMEVPSLAKQRVHEWVAKLADINSSRKHSQLFNIQNTTADAHINVVKAASLVLDCVYGIGL